MEPECLCVYNWRGSLFWWEQWWHAFIFGWGTRGSCLYFWVMFMFWHICAVSACEHEPVDCSRFLPVAAGGSASRDIFLSWGNTVLQLLFGFYFGTWQVYLFENKICDSVMISICLSLSLKQLRSFENNWIRQIFFQRSFFGILAIIDLDR